MLAVAPLLRSQMIAAEDDEPVIPEQEEPVSVDIEDVAAGRVNSFEKVMQELGLG